MAQKYEIKITLPTFGYLEVYAESEAQALLLASSKYEECPADYLDDDYSNPRFAVEDVVEMTAKELEEYLDSQDE